MGSSLSLPGEWCASNVTVPSNAERIHWSLHSLQFFISSFSLFDCLQVHIPADCQTASKTDMCSVRLTQP